MKGEPGRGRMNFALHTKDALADYPFCDTARVYLIVSEIAHGPFF
jgi:hypothetical protein